MYILFECHHFVNYYIKTDLCYIFVSIYNMFYKAYAPYYIFKARNQ